MYEIHLNVAASSTWGREGEVKIGIKSITEAHNVEQNMERSERKRAAVARGEILEASSEEDESSDESALDVRDEHDLLRHPSGRFRD